MLNLLWRNLKWRFQHPLSIAVTLLQPLLWLLLYSAVAGQSMHSAGIGDYTAFILPGILVLVTFSACSSGGMLNYIMKSSGSFYRILIAPVSRSAIVLGQVLEAIVLSFIEAGILGAVGLLLAVKVASGIAGVALIALLLFLTAFFVSALAYTVSLCLPNEVIYETVMNAIVLPLFFLSTALFPPGSLSGPLAAAACLNPFTHVINALRALILGENIRGGEIAGIVGLLLALSSISFALALWRLRRETAQ